MGSCGSCFIEIFEKMHGSRKTVLSCGIKINDELCNVEIRILKSVY